MMNVDKVENSGYEKRDANLVKVFAVGLGGILFLAIMVLLLFDYFIGTRESITNRVVLRPVSTELLELRQRENDILNSYGADDSLVNRYHIPIEQAMKLVAEEYQLSEDNSGDGFGEK